MGYMAVCTDTENNSFGIFEVDQTAKCCNYTAE